MEDIKISEVFDDLLPKIKQIIVKNGLKVSDEAVVDATKAMASTAFIEIYKQKKR